MWIDTKVAEVKQVSKGGKVVLFAKRKSDGKLHAAPLGQVLKGLGASRVDPGQPVRIWVENERVVKFAAVDGAGQRGRSGGGYPARGQRARQAASVAHHSGASTHTIPYGFIPIDIERPVVDTPVLHDGSAGGELLSGEIQCSLEALTPLLPGNARYTVAQADEAQLTAWRWFDLPKTKQIAEPLFWPDGRVIIPGSALKGMIRHSLSALLSAPMERVAERHYTYRPNLDLKNNPARYVVRPALVTAPKNGGWEVEVFAGARDALFVRSNAQNAISGAATQGTLTGVVNGIKRDGQRILADAGSREDLSGYRIVNYKPGIDGRGLLAAAFVPPTITYAMALVPPSGKRLHISSILYQRYLEDQKNVLASDKIGHLTAHPLNFNVDVRSAIRQNAELQPGQLVYVELTADANGNVSSASIVASFGHHFRYRWAYTSSIRRKGAKPRDCLAPTADERNGDGDGKPRSLTAARLMFGYVHTDENQIGEGVFNRLAGRIAINHALEERRLSEEEPRFLGDENRGYCVPLPILGQPKPSAWEFYLSQDDRTDTPPATYGDLPGDPGGDLAGRKYYRHQPSKRTVGDIRGDDAATASDQATLARYIVAPGMKFKFAVRFARLREWELGGLLAVLEPQRLGDSAKIHAHKLGLGRPLGMGSVRISIDKAFIRSENDVCLPDQDNRNEFESNALKALKYKLAASDVGRWLAMHEFSDPGPIGYPREQARKKNPGQPTIYDWHTNRRREYSVLRREKDPDWSALRLRIEQAKGRER